MDTKPQQYYLKWNDYQNHVAEIFTQLLKAESMVDVTLCVEGQRIHAHRIVLSACSPYFQEMLANSEDSHPFIILSEMNPDDVNSIVEFVYRGELYVGEDRFGSVLKAAEELQIRGLMEVSSQFPTIRTDNADDGSVDNVAEAGSGTLILDTELDGNRNIIQSIETTPVNPQTETVDIFMESNIESGSSCTKLDMKELSSVYKKDDDEKKKKQKRETSKKYYSEDSLVAALEDLRTGHTLAETATRYHIPRSSLYVKAKAQGIPLTITRQEHSAERVQEALRAVSGGASLQQAAEMFKIPKTVLWRRVKKEMGNFVMSHRPRLKQLHGIEKRKEAVKALERGENLTKVSNDFQISKATLFREKARLVEAGKLPWTCLKKRDPDIGGLKQRRLSEAVAACKEGKMSQTVAALAFQVPKSTIWRKLQKGSKPKDTQTETSEASKNEADTAVTQLQERTEFAFNEVSTQIPVTYIDESDFSEASLIILTTGTSENIEEQLIVDSDSVQNENQPPINTSERDDPAKSSIPDQDDEAVT